jgi:hypothetical protein
MSLDEIFNPAQETHDAPMSVDASPAGPAHHSPMSLDEIFNPAQETHDAPMSVDPMSQRGSATSRYALVETTSLCC